MLDIISESQDGHTVVTIVCADTFALAHFQDNLPTQGLEADIENVSFEAGTLRVKFLNELQDPLFSQKTAAVVLAYANSLGS